MTRVGKTSGESKRMKKADRNFLEFMEETYNSFLVKREDADSIDVIPTGSIALDVSTGIGGIPRGRFTVIWGPESSGKTTLALSIAKQAEKQGLKTLYIDAESGLDYSYINALVGETDDKSLILVQPETAEQGLTIAEVGINSGEFGLIIFDSVGALAPEKVKDDEDPFKSNVALVARIMSQFLSRNAYQVNENNVAFVFINQVRAKIGSYVGGYDMPGGFALKHDSSMIIYLSRTGEIKNPGNDPIGIMTKFVVKKNKLAAPLRTNEFSIIFGEGIDYLRDLVSFAELHSIVSKRGAYYYFDGENIGQGLINTIEYLKENKDVLDKIEELCYTKINKKEEVYEEVN